MEFHIILTLTQSVEDGGNYATINQVVAAQPGSTRAGLLAWALKQAPEEMQGANILFFSAEPNTLPIPESAVIPPLAIPRRPDDCRCIWQGSAPVETCQACREAGR